MPQPIDLKKTLKKLYFPSSKEPEIIKAATKANLDRRELAPTISTQPVRKPLAATEKPRKPRVRTDDPATRLDSLLPSDALKRAIILRDILGPCRAIEPIESGRW